MEPKQQEWNLAEHLFNTVQKEIDAVLRQDNIRPEVVINILVLDLLHKNLNLPHKLFES